MGALDEGLKEKRERLSYAGFLPETGPYPKPGGSWNLESLFRGLGSCSSEIVSAILTAAPEAPLLNRE
jgi:hypothetical protein